jgi:hypothetical protein
MIGISKKEWIAIAVVGCFCTVTLAVVWTRELVDKTKLDAMMPKIEPTQVAKAAVDAPEVAVAVPEEKAPEPETTEEPNEPAAVEEVAEEQVEEEPEPEPVAEVAAPVSSEFDWLGDVPAEFKAFVQAMWEFLSDEMKEQFKQQWESMSDEEKQEGIDRLMNMSEQEREDTLEQMRTHMGG